ncbi:bi-domain-containing oxidoreductase [Thiotrichales bacterium 19S9-12]|nr:bi-domain-containing oxidoreductase [Thiotrichales bacterium 19S9-11]MCF6810963.1 bi-domain-containing oxidoreductase [Thiotrichales bacterium 19S9-12]
MKQILQSLKTGETVVEDIPCPKNTNGSLLIETTNSLVSAGTERMLVEFGKASLLGKVRQQPDKVKMVLEKIKTDGLATTLEAVKAKLDQPISLGYCNVGKVVEVSNCVDGFDIGDRVVSNGNHAEVVRVPRNLCAKIPDNVTDEEASFTVLGSIALQGIRLSKPTLGECYTVIGLGLIGLITVQLLRANGCRVLGIDFDTKKCALAKEFGAEVINLSDGGDPITAAELFTKGQGIDAVIITAATKSNEPLHQAATMCRKRGRIVLVGVIGNEFSRADFYEKELSFQVSCSYGPGRYDDNYEQKGYDYPVGYVRWSENRNFQAILDMMSVGSLDVRPLISHRFEFNDANKAYGILENESSALGILLSYETEKSNNKFKREITLNHTAIKKEALSVGFLGAGNYASRTLVPAFKQTDVNLKSIVSSQGVTTKLVAKKAGFSQSLTDEHLLYQDNDLDLIVIATRHNQHARQVISALDANKHVFVEKPLALTLDEVEQIKSAYTKADNRLLMVGFNRRFAPQVQTIKRLLDQEKMPKSFIMTVNAGDIPKEHWTQDKCVGGGRIIGEGCHFIDLLRFLAGSPITLFSAHAINQVSGISDDKAMITLTFADGSCGSIHYLANGHKSFPKERLEVFSNGKILQLDNFRKLTGYGWQGFKKQNLRKQDKGQHNCVNAFIDAIRNGDSAPIPFNEIVEVAQISIEIAERLRK